MATYFVQNTNSVEDIEQMNKVIDKVNKVNTEATSNIGQLTDLNNKAEKLSEDIKQALPINTELKENIKIGQPLVQEATSKNTELQASLEKTKEFIDGLDGSQDIPGIRMELTELQNGLKSNQALSYEGSSISANNTLEGRTEGMKIKGITLQNLFPLVSTKNYSFQGNGDIENNALILPFGTDVNDTAIRCIKNKALIKPNQIYTVVVNILSNNTNNNLGMSSYLSALIPEKNSFENKVGISKMKCTSRNINENYNCDAFFCIWGNGGDKSTNIKFTAILLEGDWTDKEAPLNYFEGIKSFGEAEQEGDKYKISILSHGINKLNLKQEFISDFAGVATLKDNIININYNKPFEVCLNKNNPIKLSKGTNSISFLTNIISGEGIFIKITSANDSKRILFQGNSSSTFNLDSEKYVSFYIVRQGSSGNVNISNLILNEGGLTKYEPYKCDKKDILIKEPLRGFAENTCDVMYEDNGQVKITRNIDNYIFTGDETMRDTTEQDEKSGTGKYKVFALTVNKTIDINKNINNNFPKKQFNVAFQNMNNEGLAVTKYGVYIKILKSKLSTQDTEGFKAWLKANQTVIYFVRATPVTEIVENCIDIDLDTYQEKTYFNILNSLPGTLDFKVPSNIASIVQSNSKAINELYDLINNVVMPGMAEIIDKTVKASMNLAK